ncbi:transcriptional regulator [Methanofollis aquaemaris]|uniref:Transcriptional regulator n=1 Tax=Methanofollis aquaemaris TaxID=126734 RepID=A0A8A3S1B9_9EURY|nr:helix-turn-helix domain-containing protein [Methanofollis aquaemaris]QSZ66178.1 transcriptional regulator [Methanofollis aquaemaris]
MKLPCQVIVWDVLPAIRAAIAEELVECGASQQEIAQMMGIAPSAVSQYLSKKRGYKIVFEGEVRDSIRRLAKDLHEGRVDDLSRRICQICMQMREEDEPCRSDLAND